MIFQKEEGITNSIISFNKQDEYYESERFDIVSFIENNPEKVLDVGCAQGKTGGMIKKLFPSCKIIGIELNPKVAKIAEDKLDYIIIGDVEKINLEDHGIKEKTFDYIIYGDILEHLYDPWKVLSTQRKFLKSSGKVIVSIPNIRNLGVIKKLLLDGNWTYEKEGLLDIAHIRFFTFNEIKKLFSRAGYIIEDVWVNLGYFDQEVCQYNNISNFLKNPSKKDILELYTEQFIIIAKPTLNIDLLNDLGNIDKLLEKNIFFFEGLSYLKKKRFDAAIDSFNKFLLSCSSFNFKKIQTLIYLSQAYFQIGKFKRAESILKEALSLEPPNTNTLTSIHYTLASLYEKKGNLEKAKEKFKKVIKLAKGIPSFVGGAHFHLGCIYQKMGEKERAKSHFEECLRFIPEHRRAKENLE